MRLCKASLPRENKRVSKSQSRSWEEYTVGFWVIGSQRSRKEARVGTFGIKNGEGLQEDLCPKIGTCEHLNQKGTERWRSMKTLKRVLSVSVVRLDQGQAGAD